MNGIGRQPALRVLEKAETLGLRKAARLPAPPVERRTGANFQLLERVHVRRSPTAATAERRLLLERPVIPTQE